jgi:uncharacterized protein YcbK (DUF882 family)
MISCERPEQVAVKERGRETVIRDNTAAMSRRALLFTGLAACGVAAASSAVAAPTILRGAGDVRVISLSNPRTGEKLRSVYWVEGQYIPEVMAEIDHIMRDWRLDQKRRIEPAVIDIMAATHRLLDTREPFTLFSGYRSPQTNQMLRSRSRGVARDSFHIKGMAADLHLDSRSVRQVASAAQSLGVGGVGRYSRSNFVHMDCGPQRSWGR